MAEGIVYRCRARVRSVESTEEEFEEWKMAHHEAMLVCDLEGWVEDALAIPESVLQLVRKVKKNGVPDPPVFGEVIANLFGVSVRLLEEVLDVVEMLEQDNHQITGAEELRAALVSLRKHQQEFMRLWPINPDLWNRATKDIAAGRVWSLEETRDELRRRRARQHPG